MRKVIPAVVLGLLATVLPPARAADDKPPPRTEAEKKAIAELQKNGALVLELAQNDPRLEVSFQQHEGKLTEEKLAPLKELKASLVHLNLRGQEVTDAHLVQLTDLTALIRLHLEQTKITDKGLESLKGLTNLEYLNLYGTAVTDAGLANLAALAKLKYVRLTDTGITDAGLE